MMRNPAATTIRKASTALGLGLIEESLVREGAKGCSPVLCTEAVDLEPPYQRFDAIHIIDRGWRNPAPPASAIDRDELQTVNIFAAPDDILSIEWMSKMLCALSVLPGRLAFELCGGEGKVWVRFAVPMRNYPGFVAGLNGLFPAIRLSYEESPFPDGNPAAVEEILPVAPYHRSSSMLGHSGASPVGIMAKVIESLPSKAWGVCQILLQPAIPTHDWHYNVENLVDAEKRAIKFAQLGGLSSTFAFDPEMPPLMEWAAQEKVRVDVAFYAMVGRYAVWTRSKKTRRAFTQGMRVAVGTVRFGNRAWRWLSSKRLTTTLGREIVRQMVTERLSHRPGLMLTSQEVATFANIPNQRTLEMFASIQQREGLEWTGEETADEPGAIVLGVNKFGGLSKNVCLTIDKRLRHTLIVGVTGSGKSNQETNMALSDMRNGLGLVVIDPHGDLAMDLLAMMPKERMKDLVLIHLGEAGFAPHLNFFELAVPPAKLADDVAAAFAAMTSSNAPRMEHIVRMLTYAVHCIRGTLSDFAAMLRLGSPESRQLVKQALDRVVNLEVRRFLEVDLPRYGKTELSPVTTRLSRFLGDNLLATAFSHQENDLEPRRWMDEGKIALVSLASAAIGSDHSRFIGSLIATLTHRAALSRADIPRSERRPFMLYMDEFQSLQSSTLSAMLSEGRKYGLGAVLAHQESGQLSPEVRHALGNCYTRMVFKPATNDKREMASVLHGRVHPDTLDALAIGQAYVAAGQRVASLSTPLCDEPKLRDAQAVAKQWARNNYTPVVDERPSPSPPKRGRRTKKHDRLDGKG